MIPEEAELRRALEARSGEPTPAYLARLSAGIGAGRSHREGPPAMAIVAGLVIASIVVGLLVVFRPDLGLKGTRTPAVKASPAPGPSPSPTLTVPPVPIHLSAPNADVVWASVGGAESGLFRSTDQGRTWVHMSSEGGDFSFTDATHGWSLMPGSAATECQAQWPRIQYTADAGYSWHQLPAGGIGSGQCKENLSFIDREHGFLDAYSPNSPPVVYRTSDGGRTWAASAPLPDPPGFHSQASGFELRAGPVRAFGSILLVSAVGKGVQDGAAHTFVFRSADGGASWAYQATAPGNSGIAFTSASRWLQLGGGAVKPELTTDGGRSWHAFPTNASQSDQAAPEVVFASRSVGYLTVDGAIERTLDGGAHWFPLKTPGVPPPPNWTTGSFLRGLMVGPLALDSSAVYAMGLAPGGRGPVTGYTDIYRVDRRTHAVSSASLTASISGSGLRLGTRVALAGGWLWVAGVGWAPGGGAGAERWLDQLDPRTLAVKHAMQLPAAGPLDLPMIAGDGRTLWVGDASTLYQIDPATGRVLGSQQFAGRISALSLDPGGTRLYVGLTPAQAGPGDTDQVVELSVGSRSQVASVWVGVHELSGPRVAATAAGAWIVYATGSMATAGFYSAAGLRFQASTAHGYSNALELDYTGGVLWFLDGSLTCAGADGHPIASTGSDLQAVTGDASATYAGGLDGLFQLQVPAACRS